MGKKRLWVDEKFNCIETLFIFCTKVLDRIVPLPHFNFFVIWHSSQGMTKHTTLRRTVTRLPTLSVVFVYSSQLEITLASPGQLKPKPLVKDLIFGKHFTDHMLRVRCVNATTHFGECVSWDSDWKCLFLGGQQRVVGKCPRLGRCSLCRYTPRLRWFLSIQFCLQSRMTYLCHLHWRFFIMLKNCLKEWRPTGVSTMTSDCSDPGTIWHGKNDGFYFLFYFEQPSAVGNVTFRMLSSAKRACLPEFDPEELFLCLRR